MNQQETATAAAEAATVLQKVLSKHNDGNVVGFVLIVGDQLSGEQMAHVHNHHCNDCLLGVLAQTVYAVQTFGHQSQSVNLNTGEISDKKKAH